MPPFVNFSSFQSSEQPIGYTGSIGPIGYTGSASTAPGYTGSTGAGYTGSSGGIDLHPFMFIQGI